MKKTHKFYLALTSFLVAVAVVNFFPPHGWWRVAAYVAGIPFTVWVALTVIENAGTFD